MSQNEYIEMFEQIKVSEKKKNVIETAMRETASRRGVIKIKKMALVVTGLAVLLSIGVVGGKAVADAVKEHQMEKQTIEYTGITEDVREDMKEKGTIVSNELGHTIVKNVITPETTSIIVMINGLPAEYEIDITPYIGKDGYMLVGTLRNDLMHSEEFGAFADEFCRENFGYNGVNSGSYEVDDERNLIITLLSEEDPRNSVGWYTCEYDGEKYLIAPLTAQFDEDVDVVMFELEDVEKIEQAIRIPELKEKEVIYYNFTYQGKRYAVGLWWENGEDIGFPGVDAIYQTAVIELEEENTEQ